jgi:hypothetical protein
MPRFIALHHAPQDVAARFASATSEQAQAGAQLWIDWFARLGPSLIDPGAPLGNAKAINPSGITDAASDIIGMTILHADNIDAALSFVADHHHLRWAESCSITILEEMPIPEVEAGLIGQT